ncbi:winged helix-turn-helix domain-containing protein, partial [Ornithobacterium rhinotracheale]
IKAVFKLKKPELTEEIIILKDNKINRESYKVSYQGEYYTLPRKEFELMALLASIPQRVFKREVILEKVWG